jgi:hypothetical protein
MTLRNKCFKFQHSTFETLWKFFVVAHLNIYFLFFGNFLYFSSRKKFKEEKKNTNIKEKE